MNNSLEDLAVSKGRMMLHHAQGRASCHAAFRVITGYVAALHRINGRGEVTVNYDACQALSAAAKPDQEGLRAAAAQNKSCD